MPLPVPGLPVRFHLGSGINGNAVNQLPSGRVSSVRFHLGSGINGNIKHINYTK